MTTQSLSGWAVAPTTRARSAVRGRAVPAITVGLAGTAVALAGASSPSYWGDEAASVMSAERSIPALFAMLGNVDAVHGLYYLFLHFWIGVFGTSELATRAPSAIAVGVAAAGVLTLMRRFTSLRVAVLASVVFLLLPRIAYAGIEARSYAMGAAVAVWLTVWFARLVASRRARMLEWIGFGAAVGASAYLFLYLLLLAPVYAIVLLITPGLRQRVRGGLLAGTAAVLVAAPMVLAAVGQRGQVSFLARRDYANAYSVLVDQWFGWVPLAVAAWLLIIVGVIAAKRLSPNRRQGVVLLVVWLVLPTAALLIGNALLAPMYNIRYLTFCAPAAAMLVAVGAAAVPGVIERMRSARACRPRPEGSAPRPSPSRSSPSWRSSRCRCASPSAAHSRRTTEATSGRRPRPWTTSRRRATPSCSTAPRVLPSGRGSPSGSTRRTSPERSTSGSGFPTRNGPSSGTPSPRSVH